MPAPLPALASDVQQAIEQHGPADIAVGILTYNNADTVTEVAMAAGLGAERHFAGARTVVVNVDADSSDGTRDRLAATGLPLVAARHDAPAP